MDYIALGKTLQEARIALGLKQSEIANQLGCTSANISSWERGKSKIDIDSFAELCKIYHIDFSKTLERLNPIQHTSIEQLDFSEQEHIKKYRSLDKYGKQAVNSILGITFISHYIISNIKTVSKYRIIKPFLSISSALCFALKFIEFSLFRGNFGDTN